MMKWTETKNIIKEDILRIFNHNNILDTEYKIKTDATEIRNKIREEFEDRKHIMRSRNSGSYPSKEYLDNEFSISAQYKDFEIQVNFKYIPFFDSKTSKENKNQYDWKGYTDYSKSTDKVYLINIILPLLTNHDYLDDEIWLFIYLEITNILETITWKNNEEVYNINTELNVRNLTIEDTSVLLCLQFCQNYKDVCFSNNLYYQLIKKNCGIYPSELYDRFEMSSEYGCLSLMKDIINNPAKYKSSIEKITRADSLSFTNYLEVQYKKYTGSVGRYIYHAYERNMNDLIESLPVPHSTIMN